MDKVIFNNYGVILIEREGRFFIKLYSGGIVMKEEEEEVSLDEAKKVQMSEKDAYEVLISIEKRGKLKH
ncbi:MULTISPECIES: hypothetical protein [Enterobacter]|uniref:Uncharacterized protein n=1 Tax=Enterobacter cloacae TaxID=550 RepID=A0A330GJ86_ENTCL|nr:MULTISPECIES: hypothetical protein [Enterobacter cloacae complex]MEC5766043.1 hypothetical protein [Enterobacter chengduensis]NBC77471.1 hypothetical protein [Enterobacter asburiae]RAZ67575.1 hypothetical protein DP202_11995 [Enterobacter cloacae]HBM9901953.1 hypothetical protein [Enterobacter chengduensis]